VGLRQGAVEGLVVTGATDAFWRDKRVLLTGHSGFKGSWLTLWLHRLGAKVTGISLPSTSAPSLYAEARIEALCESHFCDIREARATFATNVMGTVHVLDALRGLDAVRVAVMVTTDKVYRGSDPGGAFREDDALGGHDPYSASKAACEMAIASYRDAFLAAQGVAVASARAGNVIGGGDWSEDRLIPDAVRAWQAGGVLQIRRPQAVRPWQHVLEPLNGYLTLARKLWERSAPAEAYNFGPDDAGPVSVRDIVELARCAWGKGAVQYGDGHEGPHESAWLALAVGKARDQLGIAPVLSLAQAVDRTMAWYRAHAQGADARQLCNADIAAFADLCALPAAGLRHVV
jgi:CDP-glucose 4,6-dehydratase